MDDNALRRLGLLAGTALGLAWSPDSGAEKRPETSDTLEIPPMPERLVLTLPTWEGAASPAYPMPPLTLDTLPEVAALREKIDQLVATTLLPMETTEAPPTFLLQPQAPFYQGEKLKFRVLGTTVNFSVGRKVGLNLDLQRTIEGNPQTGFFLEKDVPSALAPGEVKVGGEVLPGRAR